MLCLKRGRRKSRYLYNSIKYALKVKAVSRQSHGKSYLSEITRFFFREQLASHVFGLGRLLSRGDEGGA
jgi:hypothetical protein